jgi:LAO/AO transport system kinase
MSSPLAQGVLKGEVRAAARLMRRLDDQRADAEEALRELYPHTGKAWLIGITGSPGAGKSTLTSRLIGAFRKQGKTVGVVAIDPTSPFTGGAILGDRIRMQSYEGDPGVFIRSCATRGNMGGLSRSTSNVVRVLDAFGKDVIIIETVGVGQDEVEIVSAAHTTVVVTVPGMGDDIQAIKAGILEIADIFVVNKADRDGADRTVRDLQIMLEMNMKHDAAWLPPILKTVAARGDGIDEAVAALEKHRQHLLDNDRIGAFNRERIRRELTDALRSRLMTAAAAGVEAAGGMENLITDVTEGRRDPFSLAEELSKRILGNSRT